MEVSQVDSSWAMRLPECNIMISVDIRDYVVFVFVVFEINNYYKKKQYKKTCFWDLLDTDTDVDTAILKGKITSCS